MTVQLYKVQAVLFDKTKVTLDDCFNWLVEYGFKIKKTYETNEHYKFQQYDAAYLKRNGFVKYVTKPLNDKVSVIMVYPSPTGTSPTGTSTLEPTLPVYLWNIEILSAFLTVVGFLFSLYLIFKS